MQAVKPGGRVVYSTCSILPLENDDVVHKVLASWSGDNAIEVVPHFIPASEDNTQCSCSHSLQALMQLLGAEATQLGLLVLPDKAGAGPMYICVLCKQVSSGNS